MATRRKVQKGRSKPAKRRQPVDEDLALAEELLRVSRKEQAAFVAGWDKFMKQLGIQGVKPIGAKKLRERLLDGQAATVARLSLWSAVARDRFGCWALSLNPKRRRTAALQICRLPLFEQS